jgi:hypothetical protein
MRKTNSFDHFEIAKKSGEATVKKFMLAHKSSEFGPL